MNSLKEQCSLECKSLSEYLQESLNEEKAVEIPVTTPDILEESKNEDKTEESK
ncbi:MAG: hypothetical protein LUH10_15160 [Tannerellaceae bacterium]|nr:hypothetical protein [Tannerellaceae bacterium]